jgi:CBS-domain-containing membrane protein
MTDQLVQCDITSEDLRAALADLKGQVQVSEGDLLKIHALALEHARRRTRTGNTVGDLMTKDVVTVKKNTTLDETARRLSGLRISGMPVVDDDDRVIGVIGELDIIMAKQGAKGGGIRNIVRRITGEPVPKRRAGNHVGDVMSEPPITIKKNADILEAARILDARRIKRLPVVDDHGKLIGVISRADVVRGMSKR